MLQHKMLEQKLLCEKVNFAKNSNILIVLILNSGRSSYSVLLWESPSNPSPIFTTAPHGPIHVSAGVDKLMVNPRVNWVLAVGLGLGILLKLSS